jgi:phosphopantetheinyl transferase
LLPAGLFLDARNSDFDQSPMPLFYQQDINADTRLGLWQITEDADYFLRRVPVSRDITHPHKRLQHLAGRFLLGMLFPEFPMDLVMVADTRKPFVADESFHFSISHCGQWAAALVSRSQRVGIDVEESTPRVRKIMTKFLHSDELSLLRNFLPEPEQTDSMDIAPGRSFEDTITALWSAKEAIYKWYGLGGIDFSEHMRIDTLDHLHAGLLPARFLYGEMIPLAVHNAWFDRLCLCWTMR